jgi:hypothetical protein
MSAVVQRCLPFDDLWVLCGKTPLRPPSCCVSLQPTAGDHVHSQVTVTLLVSRRVSASLDDLLIPFLLLSLYIIMFSTSTLLETS